MIRENEVKRAFRIAYNTLDTIGEPKNNHEYIMKALESFKKAWDGDPDNELLKYLSVGICEWIGDIVMKEK